jgi:hypothetical protein
VRAQKGKVGACSWNDGLGRRFPLARHRAQVIPTGATAPIVIDVTLDLAASNYTVVAVGQLANIEPLVVVDNNRAPAAGNPRVRFAHASPDAPAVDIVVAGGPDPLCQCALQGCG